LLLKLTDQGVVDVLLCFDFTTERFWRPLPFHYDAVEHVVLSCVREEKLAVLYQIENTMEIWITTKIEYDDVSWSKFLEVEMTPLNGFDYDFDTETESFFIDEEKKVAVVYIVFEEINQSRARPIAIKQLTSLGKMDT